MASGTNCINAKVICIHWPSGVRGEAFNFSVFKPLLKAWHCGKISTKSSGSVGTDNNVEQPLGVVLIACKCTDTFAN